jgi:hypothetical protein
MAELTELRNDGMAELTEWHLEWHQQNAKNQNPVKILSLQL